MKADGALNIVQGFVKSIALADDDTLYADGIGNITIRMFFNDDFHANQDAIAGWLLQVDERVFCEKPRPCDARAGLRKLIKRDYFLRRNISSEAPPSAASANVPGSGVFNPSV